MKYVLAPHLHPTVPREKPDFPSFLSGEGQRATLPRLSFRVSPMEVLTHACHEGVGGSGKMKEMNSATENILQSTRITEDSDIHFRNFANDILLGSLVGITLWLILAILIMTF